VAWASPIPYRELRAQACWRASTSRSPGWAWTTSTFSGGLSSHPQAGRDGDANGGDHVAPRAGQDDRDRVLLHPKLPGGADLVPVGTTRLAMRTHAEVTARLNRLVNQIPVDDQLHLTAVVEQLMSDPTP
jgi:hypothetical protein